MSDKQVVCTTARLSEKGSGYRFHVRVGQRTLPAFVVRNDGAPRAYINQCAHMMVELDWQKGDFFNTDQNYLICSAHGALYNPNTGACVYGRCDRRGLIALEVFEVGGEILLSDENGIQLTSEPEKKLSDD